MTTQTQYGKIENYIPGDDFSLYIKRLEVFFLVNDITDEVKKHGLLITSIGSETHKILDKLMSPSDPCKKTYDDCVSILKAHFKKKVNIIIIPQFYQMGE